MYISTTDYMNHVTTTDQDMINDILHQNNNANLPAIIFNVVNSDKDNNVYKLQVATTKSIVFER